MPETSFRKQPRTCAAILATGARISLQGPQGPALGGTSLVNPRRFDLRAEQTFPQGSAKL
jgi:hypothetical protein